MCGLKLCVMPRFPPSVLIYLQGSFLPASDTYLRKGLCGPGARGEFLPLLPGPVQAGKHDLHSEPKKGGAK